MSETAVVHESYSFVCMRCGHGWEQSYDIEHHVDGEGREFVTYIADGRAVPSPLSRPACRNCDGHVVRIMRAGQVSSALSAARRQPSVPRQGERAGEGAAQDRPQDEAARDHHWHLSDLLHPFQRKAS